MYYLTFLLPEAKRLLNECGFQVAIHQDVFSKPFRALKIVAATKPK